MKSPVTDQSLGINLYHHERFSDLRKKAKDEYIERAKRSKKDKSIKIPRYKIGDFIVVNHSYTNKKYSLLEIIDTEFNGYDYNYYGIIIKTTSPDLTTRVGRLFKTGYGFHGNIENIPPDSIKWKTATELPQQKEG
ncbi:MAG: hypothetical protein WC332_00605 [Clostridia bacterium]|jgi:hypothetical protein